MFVNDPVKSEHLTKQIAFNVIPHIDVFMEDGATKEEWKMTVETRKILDPDIAVFRHLRARAGVHRPRRGGSMRGILQADHTVAAAREALRKAPGINVVDHRADAGYVTPAEAAGEDDVYVSRIRTDPSAPNALAMWVVSDNLRKGAALNAVQIAELLVEKHLGNRRLGGKVEPLRPRALA